MPKYMTRKEHPWLRRLLCSLSVHTAGCRGRPDHDPNVGRWVEWNVG